jgi:hypothetical protein
VVLALLVEDDTGVDEEPRLDEEDVELLLVEVEVEVFEVEVFEVELVEPEELDGSVVAVVVAVEPVEPVVEAVVEPVDEAVVEPVDTEVVPPAVVSLVEWPEYDEAARAAKTPVKPAHPARVQRVRAETRRRPRSRAFCRSGGIRSSPISWGIEGTDWSVNPADGKTPSLRCQPAVNLGRPSLFVHKE